MKHFLHHSFSLSVLTIGMLVLVGCDDGNNSASVPPVKNALDQMRALDEAAELAARSARGKSRVGQGAVAPAKDVPQEGTFEVEFDTTVGKFTVQVNREWAPRGAHRFYRLVKDGFYNEAGFFRVVPGFMVQFGIAGNPEQHAKWSANIVDDPVKKSNTREYVTFAKTGAPNSRTSQIFINYDDNSRLDSDGFAPFGKVTKGMEVVDRINSVYGEQPDQMRLESEGNDYLQADFPGLDYVTEARIVVDDLAEEPQADEGSSDDASDDTE